MTRKEARAEVLALLFESEFRKDETPEDILARACEMRELESDEYIKSTYFGVMEKLEYVDGKIAAFSHGWKNERISAVSRAILRIAVYEICFNDDVPDNVAVNEALELAKIYDDADKVKAFINGILNSVLQEKKVGGNA